VLLTARGNLNASRGDDRGGSGDCRSHCCTLEAAVVGSGVAASRRCSEEESSQSLTSIGTARTLSPERPLRMLCVGVFREASGEASIDAAYVPGGISVPKLATALGKDAITDAIVTSMKAGSGCFTRQMFQGKCVSVSFGGLGALLCDFSELVPRRQSRSLVSGCAVET